ncbi:uncharacterized protein SPAPADRAFT_62269 [Spathaspora passalidarum NRRL Y-27907]|uniref:Ubiquitin-like protease family profile domain-containing protein n=1 Tax=Spathaspora passalidarum (strain NRRL Y-27907 / 11-Y1) TaxID=619300 RepID=G3AQZ2_SPAPN|nr:uncharacterized protein SPAPADRAFT_62269 [Spathaspora passalidarum NRRL Y-27907]EGW31652.1 hypothetical protein SPAPADRAFT_62269 [Spathaspora passalidarum NRRL Y-27907]
MSIIYDDNKGYCIDNNVDDPTNSQSTIISNGFDQLPWDDYLPEKSQEPEPEPQVESPKKKLSKSEKKAVRQTKKINAARKRHAQRQQELSNGNIAQDIPFKPYLAKSEIKSIFSKLTKSNQSDFKLFQYHSIALYKSDIEHILPGEWLNDNDISLIYELIQQIFIKSGHRQFSYQIQLLFPSLVQLFLHFPINDEIEAILPVDELKKSKFIFIPINLIDDYDTVDLEGANVGDHWALTMLSLLENRLYVYDSMTTEADDYQLLTQLCKRLQSCKSIVTSNKPIQIVHLKCDQQDNFDDCGVYVIMITCYLINQLLYQEHISLDLSKVRFNPLDARLYIMKLISRLANTL